MRSLLLIPVLCLVCFGCGSGNNSPVAAQTHEDSADWVITTKVKAAIVADSQLSAAARLVSVNTNHGVVTLTGTVPTQADIDRIGELAKGTKGVIKVDNQLTVSNG